MKLQKFSLLRSRGGRIVLVILAVLLITAGMLALAAAGMAYDPDGHLTRRWLHDSRWGLLVWRLMLYGLMAWVWLMKVRPLLYARWPEIRPRLMRTELSGFLFILSTECVVWIGKV